MLACPFLKGGVVLNADWWMGLLISDFTSSLSFFNCLGAFAVVCERMQCTL
jgi:hypothetical protein